MNLIIPFILALATWTSPRVVCGLRVDPAAPPPVANSAHWRGLSDRDLMARTILSEQGGRVLDSALQVDSVGVAFVIANRARLGASVRAVVLAPGQFNGLTASGNALRAADPDAYSLWYGREPHAGRLAYWTAAIIAQCVITGQLVDPTAGALFFSDHHYVKGLDGSLLTDSAGLRVIRLYDDGRTRFRQDFNAASYTLERATFKPGPECLGVERC